VGALTEMNSFHFTLGSSPVLPASDDLLGYNVVTHDLSLPTRRRLLLRLLLRLPHLLVRLLATTTPYLVHDHVCVRRTTTVSAPLHLHSVHTELLLSTRVHASLSYILVEKRETKVGGVRKKSGSTEPLPRTKIFKFYSLSAIGFQNAPARVESCFRRFHW
jgi:hypothetical protein